MTSTCSGLSDDLLTSLPKELLCQIIHPLIRRDRKALRLQNRKINDIVGETLFDTITIQETEDSIRQLRNIVKSPVWSRQVQTVCWLFPIWNDEEECEVRGEVNLKKYYKKLKRLPNVKTIEILNGSDQLYEYEAFAGDGSVYSLLRSAKFLPETVVCEGIEMSITYSANRSVTAVTLRQSARKPSVLIENPREDVWEAADLALKTYDPGDDTDSISSSSASTDLMAWQLFSSFISMHRLTFQVVNLCSITISTIPVLTELVTSPCLTCLTFTNVEIIKEVTALLEAIKKRKHSTSLPTLTVTLEQVRQDRCHGEISLSDADIRDWVGGRRGDLLDMVREAFEPNGSKEESGWEDEDEGGMMWDEEFDMNDEMSFMPGGAFEDHWGSDYKDMPGYYMRGGF